MAALSSPIPQIPKKTMNLTRIPSGKPKGFTLIELMVVVTIIALLFSLTVGVFTYAQRSAARSRTQAGLTAFASGLDQYQRDFGEYPEPAAPDETTFLQERSYVVGGGAMLYQALRGDGFDKIKLATTPENVPAASDGQVDELEIANVKIKDLPKELWRQQDGVYFMSDGFGNPYQYTKATKVDVTLRADSQPDPVTINSSTYDLWSYAEDTENTNSRSVETKDSETLRDASLKWIKNW